MFPLGHVWSDTHADALITDTCTCTESPHSTPFAWAKRHIIPAEAFGFRTPSDSACCGAPGVTSPATSTDLGLFVEIL